MFFFRVRFARIVVVYEVQISSYGSEKDPLGAVGTNLNFINHYDAGESYTEKEHRDWLTDAGFIDIERANFLLDDG